MSENSQKTLFEVEPPAWEVDAAQQLRVATIAFSEGAVDVFDYAVPERLRSHVEPGRRVRVPFGRGERTLVGYCVQVEEKTSTRQLKEVKGIVDEAPLLPASLLKLSRWMAEYYLCPLGPLLEGILPSGVRKQAGTREVTLFHVPTHVAAKLTQLKLPAKQAEALKLLAASAKPLTKLQLQGMAKCTSAPINELVKKGLILSQVKRMQHSEFAAKPQESHTPFVPNDDQRLALDVVLSALRERRHETILIHGVTGSGKTEVYIRSIEEVVSYGRQAIVLVPEISLTPQTHERFRARFPEVAVLHSHLSDAERHWHWQRIARGEVQVVVGARSAVFAPVPRLGLIVLDEEHDASFKQDTQPRYHAREVALERARIEQVPLVLGSATPALESYQRALAGEYRLVNMPRRVSNRPLPEVGAIDLRVEFQNRSTRGAVSRVMHTAIHQALANDGQVILLLNRRGYSTHIQCPKCGEAVKCPHCDVALTHHKQGEKAVCHQCDYEIESPTECPKCHFAGIQYQGLGTQKLEAEIKARFKDVPCLRMDSDTMKRPGAHEAALKQFREGRVKILLGTQMIAKGLDFPNVTLVGVVNADTALHLPDFRAAERTFQLVTQVAGRTGRGDKGGRVLVQTFSPEHPAIVAAMQHDYVKFATEELKARAEYGYPPFTSMVRIIVRGEREKITDQFAEEIGRRINAAVERDQIEARVLGPAQAPFAKLLGKYRFHLLVSGADGARVRHLVREATTDLKPTDDVQFVVDVDPLVMM